MENKDEILIEAFLEGSLSEAEQKEFEARLQREPALKTQFQVHQEVDQRMETFHKAALQADWKAYVEEEQKKKKPTSIIPIRIIGIIGIAAVILLLLWLSPLSNLSLDNDPYQQYFAHLPRDNANLGDEVLDAKQAYDELKYAEAYPGLIQEVASGGDSLNLIYASVAAIGSRQAEKAIPILEPLLEARNWQAYQVEIRWYLALAYLQQEELAKAQQQLNELASKENQYKTNAINLLQSINQ